MSLRVQLFTHQVEPFARIFDKAIRDPCVETFPASVRGNSQARPRQNWDCPLETTFYLSEKTKNKNELILALFLFSCLTVLI